MPDRLLLVDDDASLLKLMAIRLEAEGFEVHTVESAELAVQTLRNTPADLVITDLRMDGASGLELFEQIQHFYPGLPVIIMSAQGTIPEAVSATQMGVFEFLTKPVDKTVLLSTVRAALQRSGSTQAEIFEEWREHIVSRSPLIERILNQVRQIASSDVSVLITGATGTGKELLARAVHEADEQRKGPMVAVNCGALPEQLLESELFGHVKGAFTGAISEHIGLFRAASGGTLFLDEIGDIPLPLQVKLLRALQERRIRAIGSTTSVAVDVRVISATNRDLERDMREGLFREDLFYRLNVVNFHLPALAERLEDIPLLANHFLRATRAYQLGRVTRFAPAAIEVMISAPWPGNVRQLENVVQRTAVLSTTQVIPEALVREALTVEDQYLPSLTQARQQFEHDYLVKVLRMTSGSVAEAALLAQRNRTDFYKLLKRHNINAENSRMTGRHLSACRRLCETNTLPGTNTLVISTRIAWIVTRLKNAMPKFHVCTATIGKHGVYHEITQLASIMCGLPEPSQWPRLNAIARDMLMYIGRIRGKIPEHHCSTRALTRHVLHRHQPVLV
ncbi:MAG: sigma 54-interacting transcriptional regulator [Halioglobus sp.]